MATIFATQIFAYTTTQVINLEIVDNQPDKTKPSHVVHPVGEQWEMHVTPAGKLIYYRSGSDIPIAPARPLFTLKLYSEQLGTWLDGHFLNRKNPKGLYSILFVGGDTVALRNLNAERYTTIERSITDFHKNFYLCSRSQQLVPVIKDVIL